MSDIGDGEDKYYGDAEEGEDDYESGEEYEEDDDDDEIVSRRPYKQKGSVFQKWSLITLALVLIIIISYIVYRFFEDERIRQDRQDTYMVKQKDANVRAILGMKQES